MNNLNPLYEFFHGFISKAAKYGVRKSKEPSKKLKKYIIQKISDHKEKNNIHDLDEE